jgi:hypothetical protein
MSITLRGWLDITISLPLKPIVLEHAQKFDAVAVGQRKVEHQDINRRAHCASAPLPGSARSELDEFNAVATGEVPGAQGIEYRIVIDLQKPDQGNSPCFH